MCNNYDKLTMAIASCILEPFTSLPCRIPTMVWCKLDEKVAKVAKQGIDDGCNVLPLKLFNVRLPSAYFGSDCNSFHISCYICAVLALCSV